MIILQDRGILSRSEGNEGAIIASFTKGLI